MESVNCKTEMTKSSTKSWRNEKYEREVKRHGRKNGTITIRKTTFSDHNAKK